MDIWITGALAFVNLALGALGGYVSLRPPDKEEHWKWFGAFVFLGLLGVVLTVVLAVMNGRDMEGIKSTLVKTQEQLADLKKPKRAHFRIARELFSDNNIRRRPMASINVYYLNDGQVAAENLVTYGDQFYIVKTVPGVESGDEAFDEFMKKMRPLHGSGVSLGRGDSGYYSVFHKTLTEFDIKNLTSGKSGLFVVGQAQYSDGAGEHYANYCHWLQRLGENPDLYTHPIWHNCERHNEQP